MPQIYPESTENQDDTEPLLTILVPTYNGEKTIARALESLVRDVLNHQLDGVINIIVADNCSTDRTALIALEYVNRYRWIKISKSEVNLGLDSNLNRIFRKVDSTYVKILADDDLVIDGYLPHLISLIANNPNCDLVVSSMTELGESTSCPHERYVGVSAFHGEVDFIERTRGAFGQISTLCFRTKSWIACDDSPILQSYRHHNMEFVGRVYHLAIFGSCLYDDSKLMGNDLGPKRWHSSYLDLYKVNVSHASFIYEICRLNKESFLDFTRWNTWRLEGRRAVRKQTIIDLIGLRRGGVDLRIQSVVHYLPIEILNKRIFRIIRTIIQMSPKLLCTLLLRLNYVLTKFKNSLVGLLKSN